MTSKRSLRMFGIRSAKILFALSLLISCISFGASDPNAQLRALKNQPTVVQLRLLDQWSSAHQLSKDVESKYEEMADQFAAEETDLSQGTPKWLSDDLSDIQRMLSMESLTSAAGVDPQASAIAKDIKKNPLYRDPGVREQSNWLQGAASRLDNLRPNCSDHRKFDESKAPVGLLGPWLVGLVYVFLGLILLGFVGYAINRFTWAKKLERRAKALLDEDEPERSLDEWLEMADKLEREGKLREAVRCLYLACLLKIDEARIARFERSQTNWEHLTRIEASPKKPANLEFRAPTKAFDEIWYGMRIKGPEDVAKFRVWYSEVTDAVRPKSA